MIDSDVFYGWRAQDLFPVLPEASVIVMDNAAFHKRQDLQSLIQMAGHPLEYLPLYSPDLNPIEHEWAQAKSVRTKYQGSVVCLFSDDLL